VLQKAIFSLNRSFELNQDIATLIAQIVCYDNSLPQGAPTSPIVSELIASILDQRLGRLSRKHHCTYSRYADDIIFSTNQESFPEPIADFSPETDGAWKAGKGSVAHGIMNGKFQLKTVQFAGSRSTFRILHAGRTICGLSRSDPQFAQSKRATSTIHWTGLLVKSIP